MGTRLYVSNLSWEVSWRDLKDYFKQCGNVLRADVILDYSGRSRGCGLVEFEHPEDAQCAMEKLNDTKLLGRVIFVREDREENNQTYMNNRNGRRPPYRNNYHNNNNYRNRFNGQQSNAAPYVKPEFKGRQIFVGNLPYSVTDEDLRSYFESCGEVEEAKVSTFVSGKSRGFGIVIFSAPQQAQTAVDKYNESDMEGRTIRVKLD